MKKWTLSVVAWALIASWAPCIATASEVQKNAAGMVTLDELGNRQSYNEAQTSEQSVIESARPAAKNFADEKDFIGSVDWLWSDLGNAIGYGLLDAADLDADGQMELLTAGGAFGFGFPAALIVLENDLSQTKCRLSAEEVILGHLITQLDADPQLEVLIATSVNLTVMDGKSCATESSTPFPETVNAAALGDTDGDGQPDVVYAAGGALYVSPWDDLTTVVSRLGFGGDRIILGPLDSVPGDEIAVQGPVIYVLEGATLQTITEINESNDSLFDFADLDGDGVAELLVGKRWEDGITAYDLRSGDILFQHPVFNLDVLKAFDTDGDGSDEVVYGEAQWGQVVVLEGDGSYLHRIDNPLHGVTNVLVVDFAGDGNRELMWGAGASDTGRDLLYRADLNSESITWQSQDYDGPFLLGQPGPYNADGRRRIALAYSTSNSGFDAGGILFLDSETGELLEDYDLYENDYFGQLSAFAAANLDGDAAWEFCIGSFTDIRCMESDKSESQWIRSFGFSFPGIRKIWIKDVNADGQKEVLVVKDASEIRSYNGSNGFLEWVTPDLYGSNNVHGQITNLTLFAGEIWVLRENGSVHTIDPATGAVTRTVQDAELTHFIADGQRLLGIRSSEGLGVINPGTLQFDELLYPSDEPITELVLSRDDSIILIATGDVGLYDDDPRTAVIIANDGTFEPATVARLSFRDVHITDWQELFFSTPWGIVRYDISSLMVLTKSGFEGTP